MSFGFNKEQLEGKSPFIFTNSCTTFINHTNSAVWYYDIKNLDF